jgi:hypothetical protein
MVHGITAVLAVVVLGWAACSAADVACGRTRAGWFERAGSTVGRSHAGTGTDDAIANRAGHAARRGGARRFADGRLGVVCATHPSGASAVSARVQARGGAAVHRHAARGAACACPARARDVAEPVHRLRVRVGAGAEQARLALLHGGTPGQRDGRHPGRRRVRGLRHPDDVRRLPCPHRHRRPFPGRHGSPMGAALLARHSRDGR